MPPCMQRSFGGEDRPARPAMLADLFDLACRKPRIDEHGPRTHGNAGEVMNDRRTGILADQHHTVVWSDAGLQEPVRRFVYCVIKLRIAQAPRTFDNRSRVRCNSRPMRNDITYERSGGGGRLQIHYYTACGSRRDLFAAAGRKVEPAYCPPRAASTCAVRHFANAAA